jgi:hypothetical protein
MAFPDPESLSPRLIKDGLGWRFSPAEAPVTFTFSRLAERRDELTAELHVQTRGSDAPQHVLRRRVNLLGTNTPKTLAGDLDLATDAAGWPWRKIVEQAFGSVIEAHRAGDEVRLLGGKAVAPPSPPHVIDGLLISGVANTWFGPGGTGKSTAGAAACVAHTLGAPFAGLPVTVGVPLYLDWEDEDEAFERILWEVSRGYGLSESARVHWRRMKAPLASDIAYISALTDRIGATLVVIDSATRAMGSAGEHGTYESTAVSFAEAVRALGKVTTLIIDHVDGATVKEGGPAKKAYGSIHKLNFVRNAWSLTLDDEATAQTVGWTHAKVNHGPKRGDFGMRYDRDPVLGGLSLVPVAAETVSPIAERMTLAARIASALRQQGAMTVRDIAEGVLGATEKKDVETIRKTLNRDMGKRFRTYSDGTWSLRDWRPDQAPDRQASRPDIRLVNAAHEDPEPLPF